ncbi:hypothetical protein ACNQ6O_15000 [Marinobacter sp. SBS5]
MVHEFGEVVRRSEHQVYGKALYARVTVDPGLREALPTLCQE